MESMLTDGKVVEKLQQLYKQEKTLFEKISDLINKWVDKVKQIYSHYSPNSKEGKLVLEMKDSLEELQSNFAEAIYEASENVSETKNTAKNSGAEKYSAKANYDYSKPFEQQIDDYKNGLIPKSDTLVLGGTPEVYQNIGFNSLPMTINTTHIDYALNGTRDADHFLGESLLKQLPEKIKEPVAVFISRTKGTTSVVALLNFTVNGKQTVVPIVIDGFGFQNSLRIDSNSITSVYGKTSAINQLWNAVNAEANGNFSLLYANKKETATLLQRAGHQLSGRLIPHDGFYHSIRENNSPVKPKFENVTQSRQFKNWFGDWQNHPKNASKVVNTDGTPKVMYHGTPAQFTAFDKKKAKSSGFYGRGFYFTDSKSHSNQYGNSMAVYLNVKNPLAPGENALSKTQLKKFLEAVAENEDDYDIWNYGTENIDEIVNRIYKDDAFAVIQDVNATAIGDFAEALRLFNEVNGTDFDGIITPTETVVFEPTQIKSATDNIGTFDGNNPDIRYSDRDYSYETLISKPDMKITVVDDSVKYTPSAETRKDIVDMAIKNAASVGYTNENGNAVVYVKDIDTDVIVSKKSIQHSLDRRLNVLAPALHNIGSILQESIIINKLTPRADNINDCYVLIGVAKNMNGEPYIVRSVVNRYTGQINDFDVLYAANVKKESAALDEPAITNDSLRITDSIISIAELLDYVNKYFPDILPEDVLKHYGYTSRPEGVLGESALFQDRDYSFDPELVADLQADADKLKSDVANLKELLKLQQTVTHGTVFTKTSVNAAASKLMKTFGMNQGKTELASALNEFYRFVASSEDLSWESVMIEAGKVADRVIELVPAREQRNDYSEKILKEISKSQVSLTEEQKAEISSKYDSYNNFRKSHMGSMVLSDKGISLERQWQEWAEL